MAPTLVKAYKRKWWIAVTSVIENLMFAAVLLGWSSLLLMLKNEGFYASVCNVDGLNSTYDNESMANGTDSPVTEEFLPLKNKTGGPFQQHSGNALPSVRFTPSGYPTCPEQDEILNRYFSIGSSLLSGVTIILGVIMDKYGSRMIRLCGTWAFMISCILFAVGSMDTENYSILIAPAVCLNGMGGVVYIFTSFPVPNLFENLRSTMIALMIGSYSASAVMYMIFKAAYDAGVPFVAIMFFHAGIGFLTFLNCYFNTPGEPIPGPGDLSYAIKLRFGAFKFEHKISGKKFLRHATSVGKRMSTTNTAPSENHNYLTSFVDLKKDDDSSGDEMSFLKVLITPCILWSFVTMCLTQLRLIAYMGWLELYFRSSCEHKGYNEEETNSTVEFYTLLFGLLQINCFLMAPVIGTIMDWNLTQKAKKAKRSKKEITHEKGAESTQRSKATKQSGESSEKLVKLKRKRQQIKNLIRAFILTNVMLTIFGTIIQFEEKLELQIFAFVLHTAVRTFLHSSIGGLYACMYHFSHFGKLTGLASFLSAMFILIQDPLFVVINNSFGGDPFWINLGLLMLTISGFGLPIYLWMVLRRLKTSDVPEERQLFSINEEEEDGRSTSSDEEPSPILSSLALAL